jgi:nicotinate phosphoribosyltransferase
LGSGVPNAITVALEMAKDGHHLNGIRLDSGDLAYLSRRARAMLDMAGLSYVKIVVSNQLDEHIIKSLLEQGSPIDIFGVGTSLVTGKDDAALDGVYKLSMFDHQPRIKVSDTIEKNTLPGIKKVFRYLNDDTTFFADAVVLESENEIVRMVHPHQPGKQLDVSKFKTESLLKCVMKNGKITIPTQTPYELSAFVHERFGQLPPEHKRFEYPHIYKIGISENLMHMRDEQAKKHKG